MLEEIRKELEKDNLILGLDRVIKELRNGNLKKVFIASNAPENIVENLSRYAKLADAQLTQLDIPNTELGVVCKKPFSIMVLGVA